MPELAHRLLVENFDFDAVRLQPRRTLGEGFGIEDVGRLVDQRASELDTLGDRHPRRGCGARRGCGVGFDRHRRRSVVGLVAVVLLCLYRSKR